MATMRAALLSASIRRTSLGYVTVRHLSNHSKTQTLGEEIKVAVATKSYKTIPDILDSLTEPCDNPNPFSFLSAFSEQERTLVIDEILQSCIPIRPRFRLRVTYSCLLSFTLQSSSPLPLSLAVLQRSIRSGCKPVPQTHLLLSSAWLERRGQSWTVSDILLEMKSICYYPDCAMCNYVISSLCAVDHFAEAVEVLKNMKAAGCLPNLDSFGILIGGLCSVRKTANALEMIKQMVEKFGLTPRQGTVSKMVIALRDNREIRKAVELIQFLERSGCPVGFESYESVVEGCLECGECILAGKVVLKMTDKGLIPYIKARQKVIEGLVTVGEMEFANAVRQRFKELKS
ncbi:hypothetical protein ACFE04_018054 [Oxalis oulophora]